MASLCQSQQRCVKASIVSSWRLAEAQDQLCSLGVHSSESLEQERARTLACPTELTNTEEEWRRKESMLGSLEPSRSMLRRWDDSQRFLSHMPQLICEETANFLVLWCIRLQQEGVM
ncbi:hypothetical protein GOODEAATRI_022918 [Goodea atripinnis]|uniref:Uncharacterized protein n=1 Tax=Goodea atripinnis TaxID=208336 RepID=A0ABV0NMI9_9TELE